MLIGSFLTAAEGIPVLIEAQDKKGQFVFWNKTAEIVSGYSKKEMLYNSFAFEMLYPDKLYRLSMKKKMFNRGQTFDSLIWQMICKDGERKYISWFNISKYFSLPNWNTWAIGVDITEKLEMERQLKERQKDLLFQIKKNDEIRTALKILVEQLELENKRITKTFKSNLEQMLEPFLLKLKKTPLSLEQNMLLNITLDNLKSITGIYGNKWQNLKKKLSPTELEIALLIEQGAKTSEIASILNLSEATIKTHRYFIRKKLDLVGEKINLCMHLRQLFNS